MTKTPTSRRRRLSAAALLCLACLGAGAAPLDDLRQQVEASQFDRAWATVQANPQLVGDVHFDFLYGLTAISVGRVAEGVLALERHLSAVPANDRARLELARGYFLLGEYARARIEFEFVLRYNPPAGVRANIAGYLQAMQVREQAENRSSARFYAEAGFGHNSNVNGGTWHGRIDTPIGSFVPDPLARQISDDVLQLAVGGQQLARITGRLSVFAGFDLSHGENGRQHAKAFNLSNGGGYIGLTQIAGPALWRLSLNASELMVGGNRFRDTLGLNTEANLSLGPSVSFMGFGSYETWRHAQPDNVRDAGVSTLGGMLTVSPADWPWAPSFGARLSLSQEHNLSFQRDLDNNVQLLRVFAGAAPWERLRLSVGFSGSRRKYLVEDTLIYQNVRKEITYVADAAATYAIDERWQLRADASWLTNRANQDIYDYGRKTLALKVRYQY